MSAGMNVHRIKCGCTFRQSVPTLAVVGGCSSMVDDELHSHLRYEFTAGISQSGMRYDSGALPTSWSRRR